MSKNLKKIFALMLSVCLMFGLTTVAFAEETADADKIPCTVADCDGEIEFVEATDDAEAGYFCTVCEAEYVKFECKDCDQVDYVLAEDYDEDTYECSNIDMHGAVVWAHNDADDAECKGVLFLNENDAEFYVCDTCGAEFVTVKCHYAFCGKLTYVAAEDVLKDDFAFTCAFADDHAMLGDLDSDGIITAGDARTALRGSAEVEEAIEKDTLKFWAADIDANGTIEAADARTILRVSAILEYMPEVDDAPFAIIYWPHNEPIDEDAEEEVEAVICAGKLFPADKDGIYVCEDCGAEFKKETCAVATCGYSAYVALETYDDEDYEWVCPYLEDAVRHPELVKGTIDFAHTDADAACEGKLIEPATGDIYVCDTCDQEFKKFECAECDFTTYYPADAEAPVCPNEADHINAANQKVITDAITAFLNPKTTEVKNGYVKTVAANVLGYFDSFVTGEVETILGVAKAFVEAWANNLTDANWKSVEEVLVPGIVDSLFAWGKADDVAKLADAIKDETKDVNDVIDLAVDMILHEKFVKEILDNIVAVDDPATTEVVEGGLVYAVTEVLAGLKEDGIFDAIYNVLKADGFFEQFKEDPENPELFEKKYGTADAFYAEVLAEIEYYTENPKNADIAAHIADVEAWIIAEINWNAGTHQEDDGTGTMVDVPNNEIGLAAEIVAAVKLALKGLPLVAAPVAP